MHTRTALVERADSTGPIRVVAATEGAKDDGISLLMSGADLTQYARNPAVLESHDSRSMPIGRADLRVDGRRLVGHVVFDVNDPRGQVIDYKYRNGFAAAFSVGFVVTKWQGDKGSYWTGGIAEKWRLLELSAVAVGMDQDALLAGRAAHAGTLSRRFEQALRNVLLERASETPEQRARRLLLESLR